VLEKFVPDEPHGVNEKLSDDAVFFSSALFPLNKSWKCCGSLSVLSVAVAERLAVNGLFRVPLEVPYWQHRFKH